MRKPPKYHTIGSERIVSVEKLDVRRLTAAELENWPPVSICTNCDREVYTWPNGKGEAVVVERIGWVLVLEPYERELCLMQKTAYREHECGETGAIIPLRQREGGP